MSLPDHERWHAEEISAGTFKNRMSALRWLAEKIDKQNIVARENSAYGIADRRYVSNESRARELDADKLAILSEPYTAMSLRLQEAFGLRREESIKVRPQWADRGEAPVPSTCVPSKSLRRTPVPITVPINSGATKWHTVKRPDATNSAESQHSCGF